MTKGARGLGKRKAGNPVGKQCKPADTAPKVVRPDGPNEGRERPDGPNDA